jgi:hypothetical protein
MIEPKHIRAGTLTLGAMIVSFAANGDSFVTSFMAMLFGAGLIFASQTLWLEKDRRTWTDHSRG